MVSPIRLMVIPFSMVIFDLGWTRKRGGEKTERTGELGNIRDSTSYIRERTFFFFNFFARGLERVKSSNFRMFLYLKVGVIKNNVLFATESVRSVVYVFRTVV